MTQANNLKTRPIHIASLIKRMLLGAGIALILITIFLVPVRDPNPAWGKLWMLKPFIVVTLAGAGGGAFYYFMDHMIGYQGGWKKVLAAILSLIAYIFGLWIGTVLGLDDTLWD